MDDVYNPISVLLKRYSTETLNCFSNLNDVSNLRLRKKESENPDCVSYAYNNGRGNKYTSYFGDVSHFSMCVPSSSMYFIAQKGVECGSEFGYWIVDSTGCIRQFLPALDVKELQLFITSAIGYSEFIQTNSAMNEWDDDDDRLIFYSDSCVPQQKDMTIICGIDNDENDTHFKHIINYSLASKSIRYARPLTPPPNCSS